MGDGEGVDSSGVAGGGGRRKRELECVRQHNSRIATSVLVGLIIIILVGGIFRNSISSIRDS
jgi:hypothetical protein